MGGSDRGWKAGGELQRSGRAGPPDSSTHMQRRLASGASVGRRWEAEKPSDWTFRSATIPLLRTERRARGGRARRTGVGSMSVCRGVD